MENLKPIRVYIAKVLVLWQFTIILLSLAAAYAAYILIDSKYALIAGVSVGVIGSLIVGSQLPKLFVAPTEFLARAVLHVSSEQSGSPAPDPKTIKASREFLERLTSYIYDMSSKSVMSQYPVAVNREQAPLPKTDGSNPLIGSPLPFIVANKDLSIIFVSPSTYQFLKTTEEKVLGMQLYDVLKLQFSSDDTLENWLKYSRDNSVTNKRTWDRVKLSLADESTAQVDMAVHYSKDDPESRELSIAIFDHSEKYGRDDSGASFVSMAVHELRTPLTIMRGYIEVFEDEIADKLDAEQSEFLRNLSVQAQQLGSFVGNIQNLARIEENSLELQLKQEDWAEVLGSTLNDMDMRAKVRHKIIKRDIPTDLPPVGVDRITIYEVIVNIVENAIKYTHGDTPITVSCRLKDASWVETTVEDNGIGIPDSLIGHVFDKFYRSHRSSRSVGGTGLGLYIAKTIVEAHGGQIWVKTKEGQGSTFGFTIPTFESVASQANSSDNKAIERRAHGWIKNHTLYRG